MADAIDTALFWISVIVALILILILLLAILISYFWTIFRNNAGFIGNIMTVFMQFISIKLKLFANKYVVAMDYTKEGVLFWIFGWAISGLLIWVLLLVTKMASVDDFSRFAHSLVYVLQIICLAAFWVPMAALLFYFQTALCNTARWVGIIVTKIMQLVSRIIATSSQFIGSIMARTKWQRGDLYRKKCQELVILQTKYANLQSNSTKTSNELRQEVSVLKQRYKTSSMLIDSLRQECERLKCRLRCTICHTRTQNVTQCQCQRVDICQDCAKYLDKCPVCLVVINKKS